MKGFCVSLQALWANQTARALLQRLLAEERRKGRGLVAALEERDIRIHDMDATVSRHGRTAGLLHMRLSHLEAL